MLEECHCFMDKPVANLRYRIAASRRALGSLGTFAARVAWTAARRGRAGWLERVGSRRSAAGWRENLTRELALAPRWQADAADAADARPDVLSMSPIHLAVVEDLRTPGRPAGGGVACSVAHWLHQNRAFAAPPRLLRGCD